MLDVSQLDADGQELHKILTSASEREKLRKFTLLILNEVSPENLLFFYAVKHHHNFPSEDLETYIRENFIDEGSPYYVNIGSGTRAMYFVGQKIIGSASNTVGQAAYRGRSGAFSINKADSTRYDKEGKEIFNLMKRDTFARMQTMVRKNEAFPAKVPDSAIHKLSTGYKEMMKKGFILPSVLQTISISKYGDGSGKTAAQDSDGGGYSAGW